jgi:hypothetical protein
VGRDQSGSGARKKAAEKDRRRQGSPRANYAALYQNTLWHLTRRQVSRRRRGLMTERREVVRRYTSIAAVIDSLRRGELPLLNPESWDDRNDRYFMELYKEARRPKGTNGLYALCAAGCSETYHHWRVFTSAADGACIEILREPLEAALEDLPGVRYGFVDYLTLEKADRLSPKDIDRLPFIKRFGFKPETEYRITLETDEPQGAAYSIEMPRNWIGKVFLNPWLPASLAASTIETIHEIKGCKSLKVERSHLINSVRWKRAGDRVAGIAPSKHRVLKLRKRKRSVQKP